MKKIVLFVTITALAMSPLLTLAGYNPNDIISDRLYYNSSSMTQADIQSFLQEYGSYLARYQTGGHSASDIIYTAARSYGLNAKVLLVMLQKEQSLITRTNPTQAALDCATGYGSCNSKYSGFSTQVDMAAYSLGVGYDKNKDRYGYDVGKTTTTQDGTAVTPANRATANLFIYNPVSGVQAGNGNYLFWDLWWNYYFGAEFYTGTLVREKGTPGVYLVGPDGKKHGFWGKAAFSQTYKSEQVLEVDGSEIAGLGTGDPIKIRDGVIFRSPKGTVYISQNGKRRGIPDQETLRLLGLTNRDSIVADWPEVNLLPETQKFEKTKLTRPEGSFVKIAESHAVYLISGGKKRPFWDRSILDFNYSGQIVVIDVSQAELNSYPTGPPVKFRDGALLQNNRTGGVYVVANGKKYAIPSKEVFEGYGFQWSNVIPVSEKILALHETGGSTGTYGELP